jgi:hypothetical protein
MNPGRAASFEEISMGQPETKTVARRSRHERALRTRLLSEQGTFVELHIVTLRLDRCCRAVEVRTQQLGTIVDIPSGGASRTFTISYLFCHRFKQSLELFLHDAVIGAWPDTHS